MGGAVLWMAQRVPLRRALRFVMAANIAIAIDIALCAASQAVALDALRARP